MKLTRFTDFGLRALMYLGAHPGRPISAGEISDRFRVSRDHMMKSLQALDAMGLVSATRGRGGGFQLTRGAGLARLGFVARTLEPSLALAECFEEESTCPLTGGCLLAGALGEAQAAFFDTLDGYTLGDLVAADGPHLVQLGGLHVG